MSFAVVARKDFADARRSRSLWALSVLFVAFVAMMAYLYTQLPSVTPDAAASVTGLGLLAFLASPAALFVSIASVVVCYKAIAGESESGSGKLLLSLPHSRADVILGKVLGRTALLVVPLVVGFVVALGATVALGLALSPVEFATFVLVTLLFALAYVSLVVGLSATTTSTTRASTLAIAAFVVFELLWDVVPLGAAFVANGFAMPATLPNWALFVGQLAPSAAYMNAVAGVLPNNATLASVPFYLTPAASAVVLLAWIVLPVALGYRRYASLDL
ncbi:MAG: ABC transporter permease subunit [Halorientalis sp.]